MPVPGLLQYQYKQNQIKTADVSFGLYYTDVLTSGVP
jgi:uncharacterized protein (DUF4213/DUF364 family)